MASRRTRIKGIANIPQRRKTVNTNGEENCIDLEEKTSGEPNLNLEHESSCKQENKEKSAKLDGKNVDETIATIDMVENKNNLSQKISHENDVDPGQDSAEPDQPSQNNNETNKTKKVAPPRRKFIKPSVSVNAINRKPKYGSPIETAGGPQSQSRTQSPVKNNKILILNEVIAYPDQSEPLVIHDYGGGDQVRRLQSPPPNIQKENLLNTPEIGGGKSGLGSLVKDIKRIVPISPQTLPPESEYPIPPPSPSKINRSRIKAIPRLGQRNTSFSASESEDESRRNHRHRNDSVCSLASGLQDTNSIPECLSPPKPKEFNSVIQRKCRRTEQSRKLAEARRDFYLKFGNEKPDRQKLTMIDLIFYNPVTNPMSNDKNKRKNTLTESENDNKEKEAKVEEETVDDPANKCGSDDENEIPAPQIKIGPQGEIVVDEQSLVIENKSVKKNREELEKSELVNGDFDTGYGVYKRAKRSKDWSKHETLKFYKALNTIGTDFALMCELFPRRSRRELKMKFKKEERVNKTLLDRAIMQPCGFDFNDFKHEVDMEEKELQEIEKQKEREKELKKEQAKKRKAASLKKEPSEKEPKLKKKKRALDIMNVLEDSDADESEIESIEEEEGRDTVLTSLQRPTRSGRVPKILDRYKAPEPGNKLVKPGSLIVVASTGPNGPIYKVCMVTGNGRQQIGEDMTSLQKALECKENGCLESLFTLSATHTRSSESGQIPAKEELGENNITISAEDDN